jgi:MFS family permease
VVLLGGAALGLALLLPAFRSLTPAGTLRVAAGLPAAVFLRGLLTFTFFGVDAYVPLMLHDWRGTTVAFAGIALTAATLSWTTGSWIQARRQERWGARRLVTLGFVTVTVGMAACWRHRSRPAWRSSRGPSWAWAWASRIRRSRSSCCVMHPPRSRARPARRCS